MALRCGLLFIWNTPQPLQRLTRFPFGVSDSGGALQVLQQQVLSSKMERPDSHPPHRRDHRDWKTVDSVFGFSSRKFRGTAINPSSIRNGMQPVEQRKLTRLY